MTTVWRPDLKRIRAEIAAEAELELEVKVEASDGDGAKQGTKRKRAPPTKGPCEHGVKYRSNCKVCSACPHGRRRLSARSAVGHKSASTVVIALSARSAVGLQSASTVASALSARSAVGHKYASTVVIALIARSAVGDHKYASTVVDRSRLQGVREVANVSSIKRTSSKPSTRRHHTVATFSCKAIVQGPDQTSISACILGSSAHVFGRSYPPHV
jgi:hypothetical protein